MRFRFAFIFVALVLAAFACAAPCFAGACPGAANYYAYGGTDQRTHTLASQGIIHCFYFDPQNGLDTATGADEAHPWQFAPGLKNCASNCSAHTVAAGDGFIIIGGGVLHIGNAGATGYTGGMNALAACGGVNGTIGSAGCIWNMATAGTSANPIYYGVDQSWFGASCGGSWCRPVLQGDNPHSSTALAVPARCRIQRSQVIWAPGRLRSQQRSSE